MKSPKLEQARKIIQMGNVLNQALARLEQLTTDTAENSPSYVEAVSGLDEDAASQAAVVSDGNGGGRKGAVKDRDLQLTMTALVKSIREITVQHARARDINTSHVSFVMLFLLSLMIFVDLTDFVGSKLSFRYASMSSYCSQYSLLCTVRRKVGSNAPPYLGQNALFVPTLPCAHGT